MDIPSPTCAHCDAPLTTPSAIHTCVACNDDVCVDCIVYPIPDTLLGFCAQCFAAKAYRQFGVKLGLKRDEP